MPNRKQLKSVASGILSSFNSRNNDLDGYWAIGKLCSFSHEHDIAVITLDLLHNKTEPATNTFDPLIYNYRALIMAQLDKLAIPPEWLAVAVIDIDFKPAFEDHLHFWRSALGKPYVCTIRIVTDLHKQYQCRIGGNCWPHNPMRECQRRINGS